MVVKEYVRGGKRGCSVCVLGGTESSVCVCAGGGGVRGAGRVRGEIPVTGTNLELAALPFYWTHFLVDSVLCGDKQRRAYSYRRLSMALTGGYHSISLV